MKRLLALAAVLLSVSQFSIAQHEIPDVDVRGFKGVKSIMDDATGDVLAYYVYFKTNSGMKVMLMDTELQVTSETVLPLATGEIGEAIYNGTSICFVSYMAGSAQIYTLSLGGEVIGSKSLAYNSTGEVLVFSSPLDGEYYLVASRRNGKKSVGYAVIKLRENLEVSWEKEYIPEKGFLTVEAAQSGFDRIAVVQTITSKPKGSKKEDTQLICFDAVNGDQLFVTPLFDELITSKPSQMLIDEDGVITTAGEYYAGNSTSNTNSDGVYISRLDASGVEIQRNYLTWEEGVQKQMKRGSFSAMGKNKVMFHDMIRSDDGGFQLIGETFSKKVTLGETNKLAFVAAVAGYDKLADGLNTMGDIVNLKNFAIAVESGRYVGNPSDAVAPTIMTVQDILVMDFDQELSLEAVTKIDKNYTQVYAYPPYRYTAGLRLSKMVASAGFFDFGFTKSNYDTGEQILVYSSINSKKPHIGISNIEKGADVAPKQLMLASLSQYATDDEEGEENEEIDSEEKDKEKKADKDISNAGVTRANQGQVLVYYIAKGNNDSTGTLNMWYESL